MGWRRESSSAPTACIFTGRQRRRPDLDLVMVGSCDGDAVDVGWLGTDAKSAARIDRPAIASRLAVAQRQCARTAHEAAGSVEGRNVVREPTI